MQGLQCALVTKQYELGGGGGNARTPVCTGHKTVRVGGRGGSKDSSVHWSKNSMSWGGGGGGGGGKDSSVHWSQNSMSWGGWGWVGSKDSSVHWSQNSMSWGGGEAMIPVCTGHKIV